MPELAEVEFYRRKWNSGIGARVREVHLNATKRIFRGSEPAAIRKTLTNSQLISSEAHGKQMIFRFSSPASLGLHLGMTGELRVESADYSPQKHDHLVLFQRDQALIFTDPRQFGRVRFSKGTAEPDWWRSLPPSVLSSQFTAKWMAARVARHKTLPLKATLLDQETFPGIGNWMADEILWQCRLHPRTKASALSSELLRMLWRNVRFVSRRALETVAKVSDGREFGDPPAGFLFHARWHKSGECPRDATPLRRETIGGRTTAWCPKCQRPLNS